MFYPGSIFSAIRIVLSQFLYYSRALGELAPEYLDCPEFCGLRDGDRLKPANALGCDECPRRDIRVEFEQDAREMLEKRAPGWERWGFEELYRQALDVFDFAKLDADKLTITSEALVLILKDEQEKVRMIDEWNRKQQTT